MLSDKLTPRTGNTPGQKDKKELQFRLYRFLLKKYADLINEKEKRTIGEIKGLINADDLTIQSIIVDFKPKNYDFSRDYLQAARDVYDFVSREIDYVESELGLNYWLSAKEIFSEKIGDDEDLAVFLCSLLYALGDENAAVVIAELENLKTHAFVVTDFQGQFLLLDPTLKEDFSKFYGIKEQVLKSYHYNGAPIKRFLYKFNHKIYEQFM